MGLVHILRGGRTLCPFSTDHGLPGEWPAGHQWVGAPTCGKCLCVAAYDARASDLDDEDLLTLVSALDLVAEALARNPNRGAALTPERVALVAYKLGLMAGGA